MSLGLMVLLSIVAVMAGETVTVAGVGVTVMVVMMVVIGGTAMMVDIVAPVSVITVEGRDIWLGTVIATVEVEVVAEGGVITVVRLDI